MRSKTNHILTGADHRSSWMADIPVRPKGGLKLRPPSQRHYKITPVIILLLALVIPCAGLADIAGDAWDAYLAGDFDGVTRLAQTALSDTTLTTTNKAQIFFTLGCSNAMQGRDIAAVDAFRLAFSLNPNLHYDSMDLPPPVWKIFKPIQDSEATLPQLDLNQIREPFRTSSRVDTFLVIKNHYYSQSTVTRSLVFPGWGHLYEGNRGGYKYLIGESILLVSLVYSVQATAKAREDYSLARSASDINKYYSRYNKSYKTSWGLGAGAVGLYLLTQWDLFSRPPDLSITSYQLGNLQVGIRFDM